MTGFVILCVWIALFIGSGVFLIVFAERLDTWAHRFVPAYYKLLDRISLKLFHISTTYLEQYNNHNIFFRIPWGSKGIKVSGVLLILIAIIFFIITIWPHS